jgi:hypothetical protein
MEPRIDYTKASPEALRAMYGLRGSCGAAGSSIRCCTW